MNNEVSPEAVSGCVPGTRVFSSIWRRAAEPQLREPVRGYDPGVQTWRSGECVWGGSHNEPVVLQSHAACSIIAADL